MVTPHVVLVLAKHTLVCSISRNPECCSPIMQQLCGQLQQRCVVKSSSSKSRRTVHVRASVASEPGSPTLHLLCGTSHDQLACTHHLRVEAGHTCTDHAAVDTSLLGHGFGLASCLVCQPRRCLQQQFRTGVFRQGMPLTILCVDACNRRAPLFLCS